MFDLKATLLSGLDLVLTAAVCVTVLRARIRLTRRARVAFLTFAWLLLAAGVGAAVLAGPGAEVGAGHSLRLMLLWLTGLLCFLQVALVRAVADWSELPGPARRSRAASLVAMVLLLGGLVAFTVLT